MEVVLANTSVITHNYPFSCGENRSHSLSNLEVYNMKVLTININLFIRSPFHKAIVIKTTWYPHKIVT